MRDPRVGLILLAAGLAPALIKKSKPLARYMGDQLVRAGEFLKAGTDEQAVSQTENVEATNDGAASEPVKPKPRAKPKTATTTRRTAQAKKPQSS